MATKRLFRSQKNKIIAGVCAGIAEYFDIDPIIVRILFVLTALFQGVGFLAYIIMWIVVPEGDTANTSGEAFEAADIHVHSDTKPSSMASMSARNLFGAVVILFGLALLLNQIFPVHFFRWDYFWPLIVIVLGAAILFPRKKK